MYCDGWMWALLSGRQVWLPALLDLAFLYLQNGFNKSYVSGNFVVRTKLIYKKQSVVK